MFEKIDNFHVFDQNIVGTGTAMATLTSTHNQCFRAEIINIVIPFYIPFYCIK